MERTDRRGIEAMTGSREHIQKSVRKDTGGHELVPNREHNGEQSREHNGEQSREHDDEHNREHDDEHNREHLPDRIKTVAVTGASGFCGSVVAVELAKQGYSVVSVGRRPGAADNHRMWDASTDAAPDLSGVDAVVHLAAAVGDRYSQSAVEEFVRVNVDASYRLLSAAGRCRVVWVSSSSVYDPRIDRSLVDELHPTIGGHLNAYGRTKAVGDRAAEAAGAVVIRPRAVYGPGDRMLLPRLLASVRNGGRRSSAGERVSGNNRDRRPLVLPLPGADVRLSLCHVNNLAAACVAGMAWKPGAYNIADAKAYSRDVALAAVVRAATGRDVRIVHVPTAFARAVAGLNSIPARRERDHRITRYSIDQLINTFVLNTAKAKATGWHPEFDLDGYLASLPPPDDLAKHFGRESA